MTTDELHAAMRPLGEAVEQHRRAQRELTAATERRDQEVLRAAANGLSRSLMAIMTGVGERRVRQIIHDRNRP